MIGATSHDTATYERNGTPVTDLPDDFYSTYAYTDEMMRMIEDGAGGDTPFFGYLAYTTPHDPLHTPRADLIEKYLEEYGERGDLSELRESRIDDLAEEGLIQPGVEVRWPNQVRGWDTLTDAQRADLTYRLATYAAMIEDADEQVGRLVEQLKKTGEYDNTLIVVASDNGAASSTRSLYSGIAPTVNDWQMKHYPLIGDPESYGRPGSFTSIGLLNAQVSSGPFFHTKTAVFEGGTRVPLIIKPPVGNKGPEFVDAFAHISDLYPTFADYAEAATAKPGQLGTSIRGLIEGSLEVTQHDGFGIEWWGHRAYREGNWKLVFAPVPSSGTGTYALYDLGTDPGETSDVSASNTDVVERLAGAWDRYALENNVVAAPFDAVNAPAEMMSARTYGMDWAE